MTTSLDTTIFAKRLYIAVTNRDHNDVQSILSQNAAEIHKFIDFHDPENNNDTALIRASCDGSFVHLLSLAGANVDEKRGQGSTALVRLFKYKRMDIIELLLSAGASILDNNHGRSPFLLATDWSFVPIVKVKYLIAAECDVNNKSDFGTTPLMLASFRGNLNIVRALLYAGANVYEKNQENKTALMFACMSGCTEIVQLLILSGANVHEKDKYGSCAMDKTCREDMKTLLREAMATNEDVFDGDTVAVKG